VLLAREIGERFRLDLQAGQQDISSPFTGENRSRWINTTADWLLGSHYFVGSGFTLFRGRVQNYDQWYMNLGYRFDVR
jgi:hypothetical protein